MLKTLQDLCSCGSPKWGAGKLNLLPTSLVHCQNEQKFGWGDPSKPLEVQAKDTWDGDWTRAAWKTGAGILRSGLSSAT